MEHHSCWHQSLEFLRIHLQQEEEEDDDDVSISFTRLSKVMKTKTGVRSK